MQLEPPPSRLIASVHPSVFMILATFSVVIPATPVVIPSPSHTKRIIFLSLVIPIAERGLFTVAPISDKISSSYVFFMFPSNRSTGPPPIPVLAFKTVPVDGKFSLGVVSDFPVRAPNTNK